MCIDICRLTEVELDIASDVGEGEQALSVEQCECPVGHTGTSCEVIYRHYIK